MSPYAASKKTNELMIGRYYGIYPHVVDSWEDLEEARREYGLKVEPQLPAGRRFGAELALLPHQQFRQLNERQWQELLELGDVPPDLKGSAPRHLQPLRLKANVLSAHSLLIQASG